MGKLYCIRRMDVLNGLAVGAEDVHANDGFVEVRIGGLHEFIVSVLLKRASSGQV